MQSKLQFNHRGGVPKWETTKYPEYPGGNQDCFADIFRVIRVSGLVVFSVSRL